MSDKLEKTGHKKAYYQVRTVFTMTMILLGAVLMAIIPIGVSYKLAQAKAQSETSHSSVVESEESESISLDSYLES